VGEAENDWVEGYIRKAGTTPRIGRPEADQLSKLGRAGDRTAEEALINANRRLVVSVAKRYGRNEPLGAVLIRGESGLRTAIERFDPSKDFAFSSYATWWIQQAIIQGDETGGGMRVPRQSSPPTGGASATA
jgi:DNA-directed RNA polymerase sigma subunit (sigma70/sigma32)